MKNAQFEVYVAGQYWWTFDNYDEAWEKTIVAHNLTGLATKLVTVYK